MLESLPLAHVTWVITTLPEWQVNRGLLHALEAAGYRGCIAAVVRDEGHEQAMRLAGIERIINPFFDTTDQAAEAFARDLQRPEQNP